jgi:HSP20 family protein
MPEHSHNAFRGLYDTFAEMARMREHLTHGDAPQEARQSSGAWIPPVDIYAQGDDLVIRTELAGVSREDMEVAICSGQLWISGERTGAPDGDEITDYVRERRYGQFRRTIALPPGIDRDRLTATLEDGLLEIVIRGGAAARRDEQIEIGGAERGEVRVDVA